MPSHVTLSALLITRPGWTCFSPNYLMINAWHFSHQFLPRCVTEDLTSLKQGQVPPGRLIDNFWWFKSVMRACHGFWIVETQHSALLSCQHWWLCGKQTNRLIRWCGWRFSCSHWSNKGRRTTCVKSFNSISGFHSPGPSPKIPSFIMMRHDFCFAPDQKFGVILVGSHTGQWGQNEADMVVPTLKLNYLLWSARDSANSIQCAVWIRGSMTPVCLTSIDHQEPMTYFLCNYYYEFPAFRQQLPPLPHKHPCSLQTSA
jgi:hypothetical protein